MAWVSTPTTDYKTVDNGHNHGTVGLICCFNNIDDDCSDTGNSIYNSSLSGIGECTID